MTRRVSDQVHRPQIAGAGAGAGVGAAALPAGRSRRGGTSAFDRVRALPDHRFVDGLLRSQAWIWIIGIALGGIVAMQVSLLKLNSGIGRAVESAATLERQNAALELRVARLSSGERLEQVSAGRGMVMPAAGAVEYVRVRPGYDARWAAKRMQPPSAEARALMANGGVVPGPLLPDPTVASATIAPPVAAAPASATAAPTTVAPAAEVAAAATPVVPPSAGDAVTGAAVVTPTPPGG